MRRGHTSYSLWLPWDYGWQGMRVIHDTGNELPPLRHFRTASKAFNRLRQPDVPAGTRVRRVTRGRKRNVKEWEKI